MNNKKQRRFAMFAGGLVTLLGFHAMPVIAQEDDSRNPFSLGISQSFRYDDNLYRLPDNWPASAAPKGKRSDIISTTKASVNFDGEYSRQAFHAGLAVGQTLFSTHSDLNNTEPEARLNWDWRVGDRFSGVLGYNWSESSVGFGDTYTGANPDDRKRITRQLSRYNTSGDFWWHPNWAVGLGFSGVSNDYRGGARPYDKYDAQEKSLNFTYRPSTGNRIVLSWRTDDGQYPNRTKKEDLKAGETSMRDWKQRDLRLSAFWKLTGVTQLSGYIGHTKRTYALASNRNFSSPTGKIALHWVPTGKAIIDLSWRREVGADVDLVSNFAVTHGFSLQPTWVVSSKVRLGVTYEYLNRDYRGDSGWSGAYLPRDAKTTSYGLNLQYLPVSNANITFGARQERRDAKTEAFARSDFRARMYWLSGSLSF